MNARPDPVACYSANSATGKTGLARRKYGVGRRVLFVSIDGGG